jgi:hypothetical protein
MTHSSRYARPCRMRALMALATVRARAGRDVTTRARPRPPPASGTSVYHVPVHTFVHFLSFKSKDTREPYRACHMKSVQRLLGLLPWAYPMDADS